MSLEAMQLCNQAVGGSFTNGAMTGGYVPSVPTTAGFCDPLPTTNYTYNWGWYPSSTVIEKVVYVDKTEKALKIAKLFYKGDSIDKFLKLVDEIKDALGG